MRISRHFFGDWPLTTNDQRRLKELQVHPDIREIAQWMLEHGIKLEQECIRMQNDKSKYRPRGSELPL